MALSLKAFLGLDGSGFELGMKRAESVAHKFGDKIEDIAKDKIAELFGLAAMEEGVRRAIEFGEHITKVSKQMGVTTDEAQQLEYQMDETGGSVENAAAAFRKLKTAQQELLNGNPEFRKYFQMLGISPIAASGMSAADLYKKIGTRLGATTGELRPSEQVALEKVMGRGADSLLPSFRSGMAQLPSEMIVDKETIEALNEYGGTWRKAKFGARKFFSDATVFIAELADASNWLTPGDQKEKSTDILAGYKIFGGGNGDELTKELEKKLAARKAARKQRSISREGIDVDTFGNGLLSGSSDKMTDIFNAAKILSERGKPQIQKDIREIMEMRNKANEIFTNGDNPIADQEAAQLRFGAYNKVRSLINPFPDKLNLNSLQTSGLETIRVPQQNTDAVRRLTIVMDQLVEQLKQNGINVPGSRQFVEPQYR